MRSLVLAGFVVLLAATKVLAQTNPVPFLDQPLFPTAAAPGGPGFTLTVNGAGFVSGSVLNWSGRPLPTTFVSRAQLTATIAASDIASAHTALVTVANPAPGGGISNVGFFQIATPVSTVVLSDTNNSVSAAFNVIAADLNGDDKLDLVTSAFDSQNNPTVYIRLGNGDGTFRSPVAYPISIIRNTIVAPIVTGDFNGDGKLDLVAGLSVLLGNGDGTFRAGTTLPANVGTLLVAGDFNGDGRLDIAGLDNQAPDLLVLLGNGDGTFQPQPPIALPTTYLPAGIATADFNGDGVLDLAVGLNPPQTFHGPAWFLVFLGNGDGTFQSALFNGFGIGQVNGLAPADFNGDGKQDLASVDNFPPPNGGLNGIPGFAVALGNGNGTFSFNNFTNPLPGGGGPIFSGDFNADGELDVAMSGLIALGKGDGTFGTPTIGVSGELQAVGDFNGDGRLDLITLDQNANYSVLLQTVAGITQFSPANLAFSTPQLVGAAGSPQVTTLSNTGNATLAISSIGIAGTNPSDFAETNTCGATLAVNASCQISVTFKPTGGGARSAEVQITDSSPGSPQGVPLNGTGQDFSLAASPSTATVTAGQPANYSVVVSPVGGFNQTVMLSCSGAPPQSTCTVTPSSIAPGATANVAVVTTAASAGLTQPAGGPPAINWFGVWMAFSGVLGLAVLLRMGRRRREWHPQLLSGLTLVCLISIGGAIAACGGGGNSGGGSGGTPTGTYSPVVTGTFTSGSAQLMHTIKVTLVVQ